MDKLRVWKGTRDESTVYLDLEPSNDGNLVTLVARDVRGIKRVVLAYITKKGIRRTAAIDESLGFNVSHGGRIALREDPAVKEAEQAKRNCPHCGH